MTACLLTISLGPVQEFIAAARKTRDLWYGSDLLSQVSRRAARAVQDAGAELIFPAPDALDDGHDVPVANKIVAIVPSGLDPTDLAARAREAAQDYLNGERDKALERAAAAGLRHLIDEGLLDQQLGAFLETYSAWQPYYDTAQPGAYAEARKGVEALLAGRKALRDFAPAAGRDGVPKSSLDGGRETVLRADRQTPAILRRLGIKTHEQLDGISLVKRLAPRRRFVSASRVAVDPLLRHFHNDSRLEQLKDLARQLEDDGLVEPILTGENELPQYAAFPFDTDLFYGPPVPDEQLDPTTQKQARQFADIVSALARAAGVGEPPAYLAVLVADGDRIGRALSSMGDAARHRDFSAASSAFARRARGIVAGHHGALVYSGGDDVLALLPLDQALDCAWAVADAFAAAMASIGLPQPPTMSVGLAIGHYHESLQDLLDWGREAERRAKKERNALAVTLRTRSGGDDAVAACRSWSQRPLDRWNRWVEWYRRDALPDGAAYELRALARELRALDLAGQPTAAARLAAVEPERILKRKKGQRGRQPFEESEIATIMEDLKSAGAAAVLDRLETMVNEMIIARHVARARDAALGPLATVGDGARGY